MWGWLILFGIVIFYVFFRKSITSPTFDGLTPDEATEKYNNMIKTLKDEMDATNKNYVENNQIDLAKQNSLETHDKVKKLEAEYKSFLNI